MTDRMTGPELVHSGYIYRSHEDTVMDALLIAWKHAEREAREADAMLENADESLPDFIFQLLRKKQAAAQAEVIRFANAINERITAAAEAVDWAANTGEEEK